MADEFKKEKAEFPEIGGLCCYAGWGGNEGITLSIDLQVYDRDTASYRRRNFAFGKSLATDRNSLDRMQYVAGYVYKLFMGEHFVSSRYMIVPGEEQKNRETAQKQLYQEYIDLLRDSLVYNWFDSESLRDIGLKSMILSVLPHCILPDDKASELLESGNGLGLLRKLCESVAEADAFEMNDMISSCRSFVGELRKMETGTAVVEKEFRSDAAQVINEMHTAPASAASGVCDRKDE